jgi:hypothetical protein
MQFSLNYDAYFWLGTETSQDEAGVAAYKTVELDDYLGGKAVHHREVQHHESEMFLAIWKGGIEYEEGGIDSGFRHVERDVYKTRLLHLKGRRNVRCTQVEVSFKSLNAGDVFVLDCGLQIYQWNGKEANRMEKMKGLEVVSRIKDDERGGRAKAEIIDMGKEPDEFWAALGGKGKIKSAEEGGDDLAFEKMAVSQMVLYRVCDESGELKITEEARAPLKRANLDTMDCFILDCTNEIFVWIGKGSTAQEKRESMKNAVDFLAKNNRPSWTPITRLIEGGETPLFIEKFPDWRQIRLPKDTPGPEKRIAPKMVQQKVDVSQMHARKEYKERMVDDGSGKLKIWRVEDFKRVEVDPKTYGQFWGGDSYIILYTYLAHGREDHIIYYWQGRDSSQDEKGASALLTVELDDSLGGMATQVRVVQGKEPSHFLSLFKGEMIVRIGGKASGFKTLKQSDTDKVDTSKTELFHVRGTNPINTRGTEVEAKATSLNSGDVFILNTPNQQYVWYGKGSNVDEKKTGKHIGDIVKGPRKQTVVEEGKEPQDFWDKLGGKTQYADDDFLQDDPVEPRLFQMSNATGVFKVEEIFNFSQDDLTNDDVYLLDTFNEVYVWIGGESNEVEHKMSMETAVEYVKNAKDGRSPDTPILRVVAGHEPQLFTANFLGWDRKKMGTDPYSRKLAAMMGGGAAKDVKQELKKYDIKEFSYEVLRKKPLPVGVDPTLLETYLSDAEFQKVFGMNKSAFQALPKWKQNGAKRKAGLF